MTINHKKRHPNFENIRLKSLRWQDEGRAIKPTCLYFISWRVLFSFFYIKHAGKENTFQSRRLLSGERMYRYRSSDSPLDRSFFPERTGGKLNGKRRKGRGEGTRRFWKRCSTARVSRFETRQWKLSLLGSARWFVFTESESKSRLRGAKCTLVLRDATFTFYVYSLRLWHFTPLSLYPYPLPVLRENVRESSGSVGTNFVVLP